MTGELRYAVLYGGLFLSLSVQIAFLPLWLEDWGLSASEIGALGAFAIGVRVVVGLAAPALADWFKAPRATMALLALLGVAAAALHLVADDRLALYALTAALASAYAGMVPLADAHGYAAADQIGFSYRRARSVGSFAFLAASFFGGVAIDAYGVSIAPIWVAASLLLVVWAAAGAPTVSTEEAAAPFLRGVAGFAKSRVFLVFLVAASATMSSHAVYYAYGSIHWRSLGWSETTIGALWAWGVVAEIGLFFIGRSIFERIRPTTALALAGAVAVVRWGAMAFDPGLAATVVLQTLHAGTFALMHLATLAFILAAAPKGANATGQGILSAVGGAVGMLPATALAAWLYPVYAGGSYWIGAACGAIGLAASLVLGRLWTGGRVV